jgi:hypothetical protein
MRRVDLPFELNEQIARRLAVEPSRVPSFYMGGFDSALDGPGLLSRTPSFQPVNFIS